MQITQIMPCVNENLVIEQIFNACRANENRNAYISGNTTVSFMINADGTHEAAFRVDGLVYATAIVDKYDC